MQIHGELNLVIGRFSFLRDIWHAAAVSRMLLFNHDKGVELEHYVEVTQT